MITVSQALDAVLAAARPAAARVMPLGEALGLCLAEDVASDIDSPPHDKALVDGYAVIASDVGSAGRANATGVRLRILEEVVAGAVPTRTVMPGTATRVMTGAPLPPGADAMVMVEETELVSSAPENVGEGATRGSEILRCAQNDTGTQNDNLRVLIRSAKVTPEQNILRRAVAMRRGEIVLRAGWQLRPADVGLLAEVGRDQVKVIPRPSVAIISTGNELVPAADTPGPGQIRNSNGPMLFSLVQAAGAVPRDLGIVRDERDALLAAIGEGLRADVLVLSGGVSAGVLDLVPGVLAELGVRQVFHKVNLKPGKPLWFGVGPSAECGVRSAESTLVFGLPGNPASTLVCFELFVRPALRRLAGYSNVSAKPVSARLTRDFTHKGNRPTYHPASLEEQNGQLVTPVVWQGSADLRAFTAANALIHFPEGDRQFVTGQQVEVIELT